MIAVAQFIGLPLLFFSSLLIARDADPGVDAGPLAAEPGRVGRARRARRGAARHRLGRDGRRSCCCSPRSRRSRRPSRPGASAPTSERSEPVIVALGDRNPAFLTHREVDAALRLFPPGACSGWVATDSPAAGRLGMASGVWLLPGTPYRDPDAAFAAIRHCLDRGVPFLGTCGGFQHALVELARSRAGIADAAHAESDPDAPAPGRRPPRVQPRRRDPHGHSETRHALRRRSAAASRSRAPTTAATGSTRPTSSRSSGPAWRRRDRSGRGRRGDRAARPPLLPRDRVRARGRRERDGAPGAAARRARGRRDRLISAAGRRPHQDLVDVDVRRLREREHDGARDVVRLRAGRRAGPSRRRACRPCPARSP